MKFASMLFSALREEYGIRVATSDPGLLRQQLYKARREDLPSFAGLSFVISPTNPGGELWIIKREVNDAED
jgi:hypothetical protein